MGRVIPNFDEIPESSPLQVLPENHYAFAIEAITERPTKAGKLMYEATLRVVDGEYADSPLFENYVIGSDSDPNADDPQTWLKSIGAQRLKRLLKAAGVPTAGGDMDQMIATAVGQHVVALVTIEIDSGKTDERYKGKKRNRLGNVYPKGAGPAAPAAPVAAAPTPRAMPPISGESGTKRIAAVPTIKCGSCGTQIPRDEYIRHVETVHPDAGE